jgi:predicted DsbA family dithiol-disulfide isomerase
VTLEELFAGRPVNIRELLQRLKQTAAAVGLPFGERRMTFNSRLAQELGLWAEDQRHGDAFHMAAFQAYFVDGKNIAKMPVLLEIAASAGLPLDTAETVLRTRQYKSRVDADWQRSREKWVTAVPTFLIDDDRLVGAQPYPALAGLVEAHGVSKRP